MLLLPLNTVFAAEITVFCYHDVVDKTKTPFEVTLKNLTDHFEMFKRENYTPISPEQYLAAQNNMFTMPEKPIMICFDDGYLAMYTKLFPLLKKYNYPVTIALITSFTDTYGTPDMGKLTNWQQIKEMEQSGLVTFASHTHAMHFYAVASEFSDRTQALSTFWYQEGKYETDEQYRQRVHDDFAMTQYLFKKNLGHPTKVMVWPYGEFNDIAIDIAKKNGFELFLALSEDSIKKNSTDFVKRILIYNNPTASELAKIIDKYEEKIIPFNTVNLKLDHIYNADPITLNDNITQLADYLYNYKSNFIVLNVYEENNIERAYFHNNNNPAQPNIFNYLVNRFKDRAIITYASLPNFASNSSLTTAKRKDLLADLARYSQVQGVIFQDDTYNAEIEALTQDFIKTLKTYRPVLVTVRSFSDNNADINLAKENYDYIMIDTTVDTADAVSKNYLTKYPNLANKLVFKLSGYNSEQKSWYSTSQLQDAATVMRNNGAKFFSYDKLNIYSENNKLSF